MIYRKLTEQEYRDAENRILYEDNHVLVLNKRPGEIVQGDKTGDEPLAEKLKAFIALRDGKPGNVFLGVPHRLDRPVSGAVILAKTSKALTRLSAAFREGDARKIYWALVENAPAPPEGEIHTWLTRNEKQNKSYSHPQQQPGAKEALLRYRLLRPTRKYFLVEVELLTGRHHQIRCQLASIGSDPLPACIHRLPHQGRPQIRSTALQPGRQHKPARPPGDISPSHPEGAGDCHRSHSHGGDVAPTLPLLYGIPRIWTEHP